MSETEILQMSDFWNSFIESLTDHLLVSISFFFLLSFLYYLTSVMTEFYVQLILFTHILWIIFLVITLTETLIEN